MYHTPESNFLTPTPSKVSHTPHWHKYNTGLNSPKPSAQVRIWGLSFGDILPLPKPPCSTPSKVSHTPHCIGTAWTLLIIKIPEYLRFIFNWPYMYPPQSSSLPLKFLTTRNDRSTTPALPFTLPLPGLVLPHHYHQLIKLHLLYLSLI